MERCPVCRARLHEDPVCGRCGTDLSTPLAAARQAEALRRQAVAIWREGYLETAMRLLRRSEQLRRDPVTSSLLAALADLNLQRAVRLIAQGDGPAALHGCRQVLAARPRHPLALSLQGFIQAQEETRYSGKFPPPPLYERGEISAYETG